jgi:hypothetical protein
MVIVKFGLDLYTQVFIPNSLEVLEESYLPSARNFKINIYSTMLALLKFMSNTKASCWINAYPLIFYKVDSNRISLDFVLFNSKS